MCTDTNEPKYYVKFWVLVHDNLSYNIVYEPIISCLHGHMRIILDHENLGICTDTITNNVQQILTNIKYKI